MAASEPSVNERNLINGSEPTIEAEQKDSSVTTMQEHISKPATNDSTPNGPQTKLQETPPNPEKTTQKPKEPENEPPTTFHGWLAHSPTSPLTWGPFTPKKWEETDVDIAITHCGVCFSDLCTLREGWGPTQYPVCVGHEIVGLPTRIGALAPRSLKLGSRLGLGPSIAPCHSPTCTPCTTTSTNYCPSRLSTYGATYPHLPPPHNITHGGFATHIRVPANSVHVIPDNIKSEDAAVLMCAGATVYEPLKEWMRRGDRVAVVGLGGLGGVAVEMARALGAGGVVVFSRGGGKGGGKRDDALEMGAEGFVVTGGEDQGWVEEWAGKFDVVICTVGAENMPINSYMGLVRTKGTFCVVGIPEGGGFPRLDTMALVLNGTRVAFSDSASWENTREMLEVVGREGVKVWTEVRGMEEAGKVVREMGEGRARYRFVLENRGKIEDGAEMGWL